ncbi:hypothetical protein TNCV_4279321, partial [Trichonephila clavipes]
GRLTSLGHWNAKRSSVPYLMYWALKCWLACFRDGVSLLVDMEGDSGRGELAISAVSEKIKSKFPQADEKLFCYWSSGVGERELYSLRLVSRM